MARIRTADQYVADSLTFIDKVIAQAESVDTPLAKDVTPLLRKDRESFAQAYAQKRQEGVDVALESLRKVSYLLVDHIAAVRPHDVRADRVHLVCGLVDNLLDVTGVGRANQADEDMLDECVDEARGWAP